MGFVNFLTYMKHLGEKALVFFPSKTDLITVSSEDGETTEELLSERLETINTAINSKQSITNGIATGNVDWNTLTEAGAYKIQNCTMTDAYHAPVGEFQYGTLFVIISEIGGEKRTIQLYFPSHNNGNVMLNHKCSVRTLNTYNNADMWSIWYKFLTEDNGVKKSGDAMTGTLNVPTIGVDHINAKNKGNNLITTLAGDANGSGIVIGGGGDTVIGGGESASALKTALSINGTTETMIIGSDNEIDFFTGCQVIANRKKTYIDANGDAFFVGTVTAPKFKGTLVNLAPNDRYKLAHLPYNMEEIYSRIENEQWEDLPIGGHFTVTVNSSIGGSELVDFVIAHINPYTNRGSTPITQPHVAIVPLNAFKTLAPMNAPSVELKNASDNVKTENHYIGTVSDIPSGTSDSNRTTGIGTSSGNTIITNKYNASVDDIIYVENSSLVEIGYYKVIGSGGVGKIIFDKGTMPITPNVEYLGMTYTIGKGNSTAGGYVGSDMYEKTLPSYEAALKTAFGTHMLKFTTLLTTSVDMNVNSGAYPNQKGAANGWAWKDCYLRLMSEVQLYGTKVWSSSGYDVGEANFQFALFQHDPANMIAKQGSSGGRIEVWLSAVASGSYFCHCDRNGQASCTVASSNWGVRPYFLLG